ncbi:hypothetical protein FRC17_005434 [Serendipita sp. 399]|nr:hypothetical protein FRC17_005434 [Serendipita sp. 399]
MTIIVGIIPIGSGLTLRDEYPLVQSHCNYSVVDVYTIAELVQDYYSAAPINRDVEYVFPLPPSAAVCSFKAVIDDTKTIKGVVKEKGEAKKAFDQAVAQGKTAGLLQQEHADVFRVSLGNIKPKTKISVHISFISIVPHDGSSPQTLRITMPTAIAPRYGSPPTNIPWFRHNTQNRFELSVSVQMNKAITSVSSPSHPIGLTLGCHQRELTGEYEPSKAFVYLGESTMLDKDIVIVISAQGMDTPRCSAERWLKSDGAEETTDAYALTLVPKFELPALPRQEYIFLVDRSGSMGGSRITAVKAALQILLRSLPSKGSSFNIVSFGSRYTSLWQTSRTYSAESLDQASKHVDGFDANYGGTELREAIEFAFNSRQDVKSPQDEKVPTSVFVLTDGEAWDLDGIINSINYACDNAKKSKSLLRTFTLGVGNQVSTAMCEGIARAGKGTAVFVAEREKPDAKLMSLLKAARGGVIEDLAVDWGAPEELKEEEDDFEMVTSSSNPEAVATSPAPQSEPPLSLFDDSHVDTPAEVGAQKAIVLLDPPPKVQQAPKSDKLPIPLYPGFRCSIFAIVKRGANPGPFNANVKITGKVMGRDVVLQIPVSPVSVHSGVVEGKVEGGRLLHTLAAKALIQAFEDLPKTPENRAQIERLGKRYSLASSATSFVAIDDETKDKVKEEIYEKRLEQEQEERVTKERKSSYLSSASAAPRLKMSAASAITTGFNPYSVSASAAAPPPRPAPSAASIPTGFNSYGLGRGGSLLQARPRPAASAASIPTGFNPNAYAQFAPPPPPPPMMSPASITTGFNPNAYGSPPPPPPMAGGSTLTADAELASTIESMKVNIDQVALRGERLEGLEDRSSSLSMSAEQFKKSAAKPKSKGLGSLFGGFGSAPQKRSSNMSKDLGPPPAAPGAVLLGGPPPPKPAFSAAPAPVSASGFGFEGNSFSSSPATQQVLSVETIARTQTFDGGFPSDDNHIRFIVGADRLSRARELPAILKQLGGADTAKKAIWATVLTYVCLQKKFGGDKDSWEMLVDKAKEYVEKELIDLGLDESLVTKTLGDLESAAVTLF